MYEQIKKQLSENWLSVLIFFALLGLVVNILIFYPGYMNSDGIGQLGQALGRYEITDTMPVAMVALWRLLINITHHPSSILILQLGLLWGALLLLAIFIYRESSSKYNSLTILLLGPLPLIVNISGVVWKDNQMAFSLFLSVIIVLYFKYVPLKKWRFLMLIGALMLIIYAGLVRYNALPALIPLIFLAVANSGLVRSFKYQVLLTIGVLFCVFGAVKIVNHVMEAKQSNPLAASMLDDISNVASKSDLANAHIAPQLAKDLESIRFCAEEKNNLLNNFWICSNDQQRKDVQYKYYQDIKKEWLRAVLSNPFSYIGYKTESYFAFLFPPANMSFVWQKGIAENDLGQEVKYKRLGDITEIYILNFGYKNFSFLFEPWFWAVMGVGIIVVVRRTNHPYKKYIQFICASSLLYLLSYFPTGATVDYRYIYWPVIASILCLAIFVFIPKRSVKNLFIKIK